MYVCVCVSVFVCSQKEGVIAEGRKSKERENNTGFSPRFSPLVVLRDQLLCRDVPLSLNIFSLIVFPRSLYIFLLFSVLYKPVSQHFLLLHSLYLACCHADSLWGKQLKLSVLTQGFVVCKGRPPAPVTLNIA